jgi:hypothetical protein
MSISQLTCWENRKRAEFLFRFRELIVTYFSNVQRHSRYGDPVENDVANVARSDINRFSQRALHYIYATGVPTEVTQYPAPAVGGYVKTIDVMVNVFNLSASSIPPQKVVDIIEQAIGAYEADYRSSIMRTFNPFFWIGKLLRAISAMPFAILEHAGLHGKKLEDSFVGRLIKLLTEIVAFLTALYGFLKLVGREDLITSFFK